MLRARFPWFLWYFLHLDFWYGVLRSKLAYLCFRPSVDWTGHRRSTDGHQTCQLMGILSRHILISNFLLVGVQAIGRPAGRPMCGFPGHFRILWYFDMSIWLMLSRVMTWACASMFIYVYGYVWESGTIWFMCGLAPAPWHRLCFKWLFIYPGFRLEWCCARRYVAVAIVPW